MKRILLCLIGILFIITENSITNNFKVLDTSMNLVLIYITVISLYLDDLESGIIGAIVGITKDIMIGGIFGLNGVVLFLVGYGISYVKENVYKESYITIAAIIFMTSLFDSMVDILFTSQIYVINSIVTMIIKGIIIMPLLNSIVGIGLYIMFKNSILKLKED